MPGSLNDVLPEQISEETEKIILDLLKRKLTSIAKLAVDLLHAVEERFGPEVRSVVKEMAEAQEFEPRSEAGEPRDDLRGFCDMVEQMAVGSHQWKRVIDEPEQIGYNYSRCMYAEIFRELGEPELGWVICARDAPWIRSYNAKLGFKRTKTLMEGDDVCDHTIFVES
jgi:hypothetical protein